MRLIDADEFYKKSNSHTGESREISVSHNMQLGEINDIAIGAYRQCLFSELEKMPTAYDVDQVVVQLEEYIRESANADYNRALIEAIDIVKAGGV